MKSWQWLQQQVGPIKKSVLLQSLWGGYGELHRIYLEDHKNSSVIVKKIIPPVGASLTQSGQRKLESYQVEQHWYGNFSQLCKPDCRVARLLAFGEINNCQMLVLEDLTQDGYMSGSPPDIAAGLSWLACFHRRFLSCVPQGLWLQGGYWHLQTRQQEYSRMPAGLLKDYAHGLDLCLRQARFKTLIHGDAKPANFLWRCDGQAAAVDFQYVGTGCGIGDVAYFLDCCLKNSRVEQELNGWLDFYFAQLTAVPELEQEWRRLFPVAWSDYARFYQGWGPGTPLSACGEQVLQQALQVLHEEQLT